MQKRESNGDAEGKVERKERREVRLASREGSPTPKPLEGGFEPPGKLGDKRPEGRGRRPSSHPPDWWPHCSSRHTRGVRQAFDCLLPVVSPPYLSPPFCSSATSSVRGMGRERKLTAPWGIWKEKPPQCPPRATRVASATAAPCHVGQGGFLDGQSLLPTSPALQSMASYLQGEGEAS